MAAKKGLGRGLGALIKDEAPADTPVSQDSGINTVPITSITRNRRQPRRAFDESAINDLSASVKEHGILQPLLVRPDGEGSYELIAGERRLRAATGAGLKSVPVIVLNATDGDSLELALIENLQRENLNVIEEAEGYQQLAVEFNLTQEEIADRMGKARASITNALRLLALPDEIRAMLSAERISRGHAKALLAVAIEKEQILLARRVVSEGLSVRDLEKIIKRLQAPQRKPRAAKPDLPGSHVSYLSDQLHAHFGTSVRVTPCRTYANGKKGKGYIEIDFYSNEDLDRVLALMGINGEE
jgi:ParB family chromosome partitioning protein